jgi:hypothetical protein
MEALFAARPPEFLCPYYYLPKLKEAEQGSSLHASFMNAITIAFDLVTAF